MEEQKNVELEDNQLVLKTLLINPTDEENVASSSTNEAKKSEEAESTANSSQKEEEKHEEKTTTSNRSSPEPSCAICLEQLQNKSFTDSCFHMFCFTCLVEWSKVKPECPLCKQSFKSIVHNVRSFEDYDQYYIRSKSSEGMMQLYGNERSFRYRTTMATPVERYRNVMSSDRLLDRNHIQHPTSLQNEIASHRMRYAPHSIQMYTTSQFEASIPCIFRRRVYNEDLWVQPSNSGRVRCSTPEFYRANIACTHRLLPWLNRELLALMQNNENQVSFVIELIMALIIRFEISSEEFFLHIEPYLGSHTNHFVHEFYNYAISPYNMELYDVHARYNGMSFDIRPVSPDSDVIPIPTNESTSRHSSVPSVSKKKRHHSKRKQIKEYKRRLKITLKRNGENCWENVGAAELLNINEFPRSNAFEVAGPSTHSEPAIPGCSTSSSNQENDKSNDVEFFDDECQIVGYVKPRCERTPEIVDISSGDEPENIINVPSDDDLVCSPPSVNANSQAKQTNNCVSDDDIIFISETKNSETTDKPIDYSLKRPDADSGHEDEGFDSPSCSGDKNEFELLQVRNKSVIQSCVRALSNENDPGSSSWSPSSKPKKRRATILDDSSTESCSESAQVTELDSRIKKLKLRSVVAHFSYDPSDERNDSSHHLPSHKKHKEKKKKKKKHKSKHKHRIYSSDSN